MIRLLFFTSLFVAIQISSFGELIVTEIMYHPVSADTTVDEGVYEFIEFKNAGTESLDLSGYIMDQGIVYFFPSGLVLDPGAYYVLSPDTSRLVERYGNDFAYDLSFGGLKNSGEDLRVRDAQGNIIFKMEYNDAAPWPTVADGFGFSLVLVEENKDADFSNGNNWQASSELGGSPGEADLNDPVAASVVINEIISSPNEGEIDYVELKNIGTESVDIGGWYLTDDRNEPVRYRIPVNTIVEPGGHYVINENLFNPFGLGFSFSRKGDQVYIYSGDGAGGLTGYSHGFSFDAQLSGYSFGRHVTSDGEEYLFTEVSPTIGSENEGPLVGPIVITQLMYDPDVYLDEFMRIDNISAEEVEFLTSSLPDSNAYRLGGVTLKFPFAPDQVTLAPNDYLYVTEMDADSFRTKYSIQSDVQVFQYEGALNNGGECISIEHPIYRDTLSDGSYDNAYRIIDEVCYSKSTYWPSVADNGMYLKKVIEDGFGSEPMNWEASDELLGLEIISHDEEMAIYPNVGQGAITIPDELVGESFEICSVSGKVLESGTLSTSELDLDLPVGNSYLLRIGSYSWEIVR
jgi:hypothetical protein